MAQWLREMIAGFMVKLAADLKRFGEWIDPPGPWNWFLENCPAYPCGGPRCFAAGAVSAAEVDALRDEYYEGLAPRTSVATEIPATISAVYDAPMYASSPAVERGILAVYWPEDLRHD